MLSKIKDLITEEYQNAEIAKECYEDQSSILKATYQDAMIYINFFESQLEYYNSAKIEGTLVFHDSETKDSMKASLKASDGTLYEIYANNSSKQIELFNERVGEWVRGVLRPYRGLKYIFMSYATLSHDLKYNDVYNFEYENGEFILKSGTKAVIRECILNKEK